jgi:hypothetical protein
MGRENKILLFDIKSIKEFKNTLKLWLNCLGVCE